MIHKLYSFMYTILRLIETKYNIYLTLIIYLTQCYIKLTE